MSVVTVRNLPEKTHRALKRRAVQHGRSTEAEMPKFSPKERPSVLPIVRLLPSRRSTTFLSPPKTCVTLKLQGWYF